MSERREVVLRLLAAGCLLTVVGAGCSESSFKGGSGRRSLEAKPEEPVKPGASDTRTLKVTCQPGSTGEARLVTTLTGSKLTKAKVEGEFCGVKGEVQSAKMSVLFVLDYSGSMTANDPADSGTCGRLMAGQAILRKMQASAAGGGGQIDFGVMTFADGATATVPLQPMGGFDANLTEGNFCGSSRGATNYEAAFTEAKNILTAAGAGKKVIYFISDGMPTKAGTGVLGTLPSITSIMSNPMAGVHEAGLKAAEALRAQLPDVVINAVYLGNNQPLDPVVTSGITLPDPQTYLGQITGDPQRVRVVGSADALAAQIVTLDTPQTGGLDGGNAQASLKVGSAPARSIAVIRLAKDPAREGVWFFETEPFELTGTESQATQNELVVSVRSSDGKEYRATANVSFVVQAGVSGQQTAANTP